MVVSIDLVLSGPGAPAASNSRTSSALVKSTSNEQKPDEAQSSASTTALSAASTSATTSQPARPAGSASPPEEDLAPRTPRTPRSPQPDADVGLDTGGDDQRHATRVATPSERAKAADVDGDDAVATENEEADDEEVTVSEPDRGRRVIEVAVAPRDTPSPVTEGPLPTTTLNADETGRSSTDLWVTGAVALAVGAAGLGSLIRGPRVPRPRG